MNKKLLRRIALTASAAVIAAGTVGMLSACSSDHPEVTVTYSFEGKEYKVEYVLSRHDAPRTVTHFIELADAGYYDGQFIVHDFTDEYLMTGGYRLGTDSDLEEVNYFAAVEKLEGDLGITFTQSVWRTAGSSENVQKGDGLYTVYGEIAPKFKVEGGTEYSHTQGALVMYYSDKGKYNGNVTIERADGGKNNNGEPLEAQSYSLNSATSLFYTQLSASTPSSHKDSEGNDKYCVFGKVKDYSVLEEGLLAAIETYKANLADDATFTRTVTVDLNVNEPFDDLKTMGLEATFEMPVEPIRLVSVEVTKY